MIPTLLEKIEEYKENGKSTSRFLQLIENNYNGWKNELETITLFLNDYYNNITCGQRLYHIWFNDYEIKRCPICNNICNSVRGFSRLKYNYSYTCSNKKCVKKYKMLNCYNNYGVYFYNQIYEIREKSKQTCLEKYGVEHYSQTKEFNEKIIKTCLEKYGVESYNSLKKTQEKRKRTCLQRYNETSYSKTNECKEKVIKTNLEKYGEEYYNKTEECKEKTINTCLERYGVRSHNSLKETQEKKKDTCLKRYGVKNVMQNNIIFEKAKQKRFKLKSYILPSGKEVKIQGYEPIFLDEYFNSGGLESNIAINDKDIENTIGIIWYETLDGNKHRYYPDCYLIDENKIIEVKSTWTIKIDKEIQEFKRQACLNMNLDFEFKIY